LSRQRWSIKTQQRQRWGTWSRTPSAVDEPAVVAAALAVAPAVERAAAPAATASAAVATISATTGDAATADEPAGTESTASKAGGAEAGETEAKAIVDWLGKKVSNHKRLRGGIVFVDQVPKSASGKILRRLLKERSKTDTPMGITSQAKL